VRLQEAAASVFLLFAEKNYFLLMNGYRNGLVIHPYASFYFSWPAK